MPFDEFVKNNVDFYGVINMLHSFREGNDRTQRVFFTQLIRYAGCDIDFAKIDPDELMVATIQVASGVEDWLRYMFGKAICINLLNHIRCLHRVFSLFSTVNNAVIISINIRIWKRNLQMVIVSQGLV